MYSIYADGVCIYNDVFTFENQKIINPKLTMEDNAAGSLSLTLPPSNIGYSTIIRMATTITVQRNGEEIWEGRVLSEKKDFWNNRVLYCEGALAFFNDSTQPPAEYKGQTVREFLETLVSIHNAKVSENRQFTVGVVTVTDDQDVEYHYTNYEKTIKCINTQLLNVYEGHLQIRKVDDIRYLDYLADYPNTNSQIIRFGENLLDFTRNWDMSEFATVIVPLGNRLDESDIESLEAYLTVADVNSGSIYVVSSDAIEAYGWIEKVLNLDDVSSAATLLSLATEYLSEIQFDNMTLELSALDLHYLNVDSEAIKLLDKIRVISSPHGMDKYFPVRKIEIPLDSPENTTFELGDGIETTLTSVNNQVSSDILERISNLPTKQTVLSEAKENATAIMNMATNGYITITQEDNATNVLYISDTVDYTQATRLWKWGINGLGYSNDGGETYGLAMTMDGAIVADFITVGTLRAIDIESCTMSATTITGGTININDKFTVDSSGNVVLAGNISMTGAISWSADSSPIKVQYSDDNSTWYNDFQSSWVGSTTTQVWAKYSYDGGTTWTDPVLIQGKSGEDGSDGSDGSDATVNFTNVNNILKNYFGIDGGTTQINSSSLYSPTIYAAKVYAGEGQGFAEMLSTGFNVYTPSGYKKIGIGWNSSDYEYPYITLGVGSDEAQSTAGMVKKFNTGIWIGNAASKNSSSPSGTGIFVDFNAGTIYQYIDGTASSIGGGNVTAVWG